MLCRQLSDVSTDDLDLRYTWISDKLHAAGYDCYWYGKGHTGYKSMRHLPTAHGFKHFMGFLSGSQSYTAADRWEDDHPVQQDSEFVNPPPNCGDSLGYFERRDAVNQMTARGRRLEEGGTCTLEHSENSNYTCSDSNPRRLTTVDCCASCEADANCSHFVLYPPDQCVLHGPNARCIHHPDPGVVSGVHFHPTPGPPGPPGPAPPPAGPTKCARSYSTTLYGELCLSALAGHDATTPFFLYFVSTSTLLCCLFATQQ